MSEETTKNNGDASALREALDEIIDKIDKWRTEGSMEHWQYSQLFDIADSALAKPARNCDVGTADEQAKRHEAYCSRSRSCFHSGCIRKCFAEWAQMPYTEGSAK